MHFKQILVVKETHENEKRISLTPTVVAQLTQQGYRVLIEQDAGINAGFTNNEYLQSGAELFILSSAGFPDDTFIVRVLRPSHEREQIENNLFGTNNAMLGFLFPFVADNHITTWQSLNLTTLSFDLFKSLTIDDPKNAQAAMSRIAGKLAMHDALEHYHGEKPAFLTIIGAGAAGLSAAYEGLRCGISVQVFGRKESLRQEVESKGATYHVLPTDIASQIKFIRAHLTDATIIITAARTAGKKAPLLIDDESLHVLPNKAVVIDLAIGTGGNVIGSKYDQTITLDNGVILHSVSGYPKREPKESSEIYSQCVYHLLAEIMSPTGELAFDNHLIQEIWVTHNGHLHNELYDTFKYVSKEKRVC